jgi:hypothetical protein
MISSGPETGAERMDVDSLGPSVESELKIQSQ